MRKQEAMIEMLRKKKSGIPGMPIPDMPRTARDIPLGEGMLDQAKEKILTRKEIQQRKMDCILRQKDWNPDTMTCVGEEPEDYYSE